MQRHSQHISFLLLSSCCLLLAAFNARAQQGVFIPPSGHVFSHPADTVSIFSNVLNEGNFGSTRGSVINFLGVQWENTPPSLMPGNSGRNTPGGLFRFVGAHEQTVAGGYSFNAETGPSFPNISIENRSGIQLKDINDLHIRGNLHFSKGYLFLNGWNILINDSITGYSEKGFVVTGNNTGGGYLYRKPSSRNDMLIFPVGTDTQSYTPLALKTNDPLNMIVGTHVFNHVYEHVTKGKILDSDYVKKTWKLVAAQNISSATLLLQHNNADEGARFDMLRDSSYISRYNVNNHQWDIDSFVHNLIKPGDLTTGNPKSNTYINDRIFSSNTRLLDSVNWFSLSVAGNSRGCPLADFKLWAAKRYNYRRVQLFWRTRRELNVQTYEVQRRRDTGSIFQTIAAFDSKGIGGFSDQPLYYYYADDNIYDGWSYYRLKMISAGGCIAYTNIQEVPRGIDVEVWPNPSPGEAHVRVTGIKHPITMRLADTWGRVLRRYTINGDGILDIKGLSDAVYFLVFYDPQNNNGKITTVKLVAQHRR